MANRNSEQPIDLAGRVTLSLAEAAAALGVSEGHVRNHISQLPHFRMGNKPLIPVEALKQWTAGRAKEEQANVEATANSILEEMKHPREK